MSSRESLMSCAALPHNRPPSNEMAQHDLTSRGTSLQRTVAVVNSRVTRFATFFSRLIGTASNAANLKGLSATNFSKRPIVRRFRPLCSIVVAPSVLYNERQRTRADSENNKCEYGNTE